MLSHHLYWCLCLIKKQRTVTRLVCAKRLSLVRQALPSRVIRTFTGHQFTFTAPFTHLCALTLSFTPSPHPFTGPPPSSVLSATLPRLTDPQTLRYHPAQVEAESRGSIPRRFYQICRLLPRYKSLPRNLFQQQPVAGGGL